MQKYLKTNSKHSQSLFDLVMFLTVTSFPLIDLKKLAFIWHCGTLLTAFISRIQVRQLLDL